MEFNRRRLTYRGGDLEMMVQFSPFGHLSGSGDSRAAAPQQPEVDGDGFAESEPKADQLGTLAEEVPLESNHHQNFQKLSA